MFVPSFRNSTDTWIRQRNQNKEAQQYDNSYVPPADTYFPESTAMAKANLSLSDVQAIALFGYTEYYGTIECIGSHTAHNVRLHLEYLDDNENIIQTKELHLYEKIEGFKTAQFKTTDRNPSATKYRYHLEWD